MFTLSLITLNNRKQGDQMLNEFGGQNGGKGGLFLKKDNGQFNKITM